MRGAVSDDGAIEVVTIDGAVVDAPGGRFAHAVALEEGANLIRITARDSTAKESEATVAVTLDREPPRVTIRTPAAVAAAQQRGAGPYSLSTNLPSIAVAGLADDENGVERVEIEGAPVTLPGGEFDQAIALEAGLNRVTVEATDRAGNVGSVELEIDRSTAPSIAIVEPEDGAIVLERSIAVRGTVSDPEAVVTVNGVAASVQGTTFVVDDLPLDDGATLINAVAIDRSGLESAAGVTVLRDVEAPLVVIHDPVEGSVVYASEISVVGMVNDVVVGTVNGAQVTVTVNGVAAEVADRSFLLDRVPLAIGDNTIEVTATDRGGNVGRDEVVVRREPQVGPVLSVISGDRQTGVIGEVLPLPLVVALRDPLGVPVPDRIVTFVADGTDGTLGGGKREVAVRTNGAGLASVVLTLGRRAGHHSVRATATGVAGEALFVVRALAGEPAVLVVDSGDQQVGSGGPVAALAVGRRRHRRGFQPARGSRGRASRSSKEMACSRTASASIDLVSRQRRAGRGSAHAGLGGRRGQQRGAGASGRRSARSGGDVRRVGAGGQGAGRDRGQRPRARQHRSTGAGSDGDARGNDAVDAKRRRRLLPARRRAGGHHAPAGERLDRGAAGRVAVARVPDHDRSRARQLDGPAHLPPRARDRERSGRRRDHRRRVDDSRSARVSRSRSRRARSRSPAAAARAPSP